MVLDMVIDPVRTKENLLKNIGIGCPRMGEGVIIISCHGVLSNIAQAQDDKEPCHKRCEPQRKIDPPITDETENNKKPYIDWYKQITPV